MPYRDPPRTLGEHLRIRRYELGIFQKDAARELSVNQWTLIGWEADRKKPTVRFMSRIIKFLGYYPFLEPRTLGGRLLATRRRLGLSQVEMAQKLEVDKGTIWLIEAGRRSPNPDTLAKIERNLQQETAGALQGVPAPPRCHP